MPEGVSESTGGILVGGTSATIFGTDGDDTIVITPGDVDGEVRVSGVAGVPDGTVISDLRYVGIEGGKGNDHITGDLGRIPWGHISGGDGDDVLITTGHMPDLVGGRGDDLIEGSADVQTLEGGPGNDTIDGGGGNDDLYVGSVYCSEPLPIYMAVEDCITSGVVVRMDLGTIPNDGFGGQDEIANIRNVLVFSYLDDVVYGDHEDNLIVCCNGSDTIYGGGGDDYISLPRGSGLLSGGEGNDTLFTQSADVIMEGGAGQNICTRDIREQTPVTPVLPPPSREWNWFEKVDPNRKVAMPEGASESTGGILIQGTSATIYGTDGNDTIVVTPGAVEGQLRVSGVAGLPDGTVISDLRSVGINGGNGDDEIRADLGRIPWGGLCGGDGDDVLIATGPMPNIAGGRGNDLIKGSAGYENLDGGPGNDTIDGGGGGDLLSVGSSYPPQIAAIVGEECVTSGIVVPWDLVRFRTTALADRT